MKSDTVKQYVTLRASLEQERSQLQSRLQEIEAALGVTGSTALPVVKRGLDRPKGTKPIGTAVAVENLQAPKRKYKRSAAARKAMALAQRARFAKAKAAKEAVGAKPVAKEGPTSAKPKRKISAAGKARIAAAAKARWAKVRAQKAGKK